jgi:hypothetical protein
MRFGSDNGAMSVVRPIFSELKRDFFVDYRRKHNPTKHACMRPQGRSREKKVISGCDAYHMSIVTQMTTDLGERSPE